MRQAGRQEECWQKMCRALAAFKARHKHCNVPTNGAGNRRLGRWVATQRYRRKIGRLTEQQVRALDRLGFVWAPGDVAWERMFRELTAFKRKFGHANVPSHWPANENLASWVANQRHRRKMGLMSAERVHRLEALGFTWSLYRCSSEPPAVETRTAPRKQSQKGKDADEASASRCEERLYHIGNGLYVQHNPKVRKPPELVRYIETHGGDYPPYIPLPAGPVVFNLGDTVSRKAKRLVWKGRGKLPREILDYVSENGVLPPHN